MQNGIYQFFNGTAINLHEVVDVGPIHWADDGASTGAVGTFFVTELSGQSQRIECTVSALVGPVRFMAAVRNKVDHVSGECPARLAYLALSHEAKRVLSIRHGDLVSAWRSTADLAMAA